MQKLLIPAVAMALVVASCGSKDGKKDKADNSICKSECFNDSLKFGESGKGRPYVYITAKDCSIDSIFWGTHGMGTVRGVKFNRPEFRLNKEKIRCLITGGSYAYLMLNDCETRKGVVLKMLLDKLPPGKKESFMMTGKGINNGNPKFSVADNLVVTCDGGNLLIEDVATGKQATMTFGKWIEDIDYDAVQEYIDSVNITNAKGWARVKMDGQWKVVEKNLELK
jgi:hypothetical protein